MGKQLNYVSSCKLCAVSSPPSPCSPMSNASTMNGHLSSIYVNYSNQN